MPIELTENAMRELVEIGQAVEKAGSREAVEVRLPKGVSVADENEIVVMVFSRGEGLAYARQVPEGAPKTRDIVLWMASAEQAIHELASQSENAPPLPTAESVLLDKAGLVVADRKRPGAFERSRIAFDIFLQRESWTLERAASVLDVSTGRLRQRLSSKNRTLYGIKDGRAWRIPKFQFVKRKLVRGIEDVLPHVRRDAHPLAVRTWFTSPHQDLVEGEDERPVSPIEWLSSGRPSEVVAALAEEI